MIERDSLTEAFFAAIGATVADHTICAATMGAAWESVFGDMASADPLDVVNSDLVVIWGANPTVSNTHFPPLVQQAVARGAKLVVIDPRRTAMAKRADLHLAIRPGTDVALGDGDRRPMGRQRTPRPSTSSTPMPTSAEEFLARAPATGRSSRAAEVCGLEADDIRTLADWWGSTRRSMLRIGWGQERNSNGGAACRAILALPVLAGHFGEPGAGVIGSTSPGAVRPRRRWPAFARLDRRSLPLHQIGEWMRPGSPDPCRVLFVQGANPAVMCPDQRAVDAALGRDDVFTVVHEQVLTDTTRYADVVLPATTSFEIDDVAMQLRLVDGAAGGGGDPARGRESQQRPGRLGARQGVRARLGDGRPRPPAIDDPGPRLVDVPSRQFVDTFPPADGSTAGPGSSTRSTACLRTSPSNDARRAASR